MLTINFELNPSEIEEKIHGYSMGHIIIEGEFSSATSKNRRPDQSMMIFLAITDLLSIAIWLSQKTGHAHKIFVGVDSSFTIHVYRKYNYVEVFADGRLIDRMLQIDFVNELSSSVNQFLSVYSSKFDSSDNGGGEAFTDLYTILEEFEILCFQTPDNK